MDIIAEIKSLKLPSKEFTVIGSALLDIYKLRPAHDIDLVITKKLFKHLKEQGWEYENRNGVDFLHYKKIEATYIWDIKTVYGHFNETPESLIDNSIKIEEINFVNINKIIELKTVLHRKKDQEDINLLSLIKYLH